VQNLTELIPLADKAVRPTPTDVRLLGAAFYRNGQFEQAIKSLEDSAKVRQDSVWNLSFRAMAHFKVGHLEFGQEYLGQAKKLMEDPEAEKDVANRNRIPVTWYGRLEKQLLYKEATALLTGSTNVENGSP
jgi:uncharacterized protein HemY